MTQFALHKDTHDIFFTATGQLVMLSTPDEVIVQRIKTTFNTFKGEWFLDESQGVPYIQEIFVANPDLVRIRALLLSVLINIVGVTKVRSFDVSFDSAARKLLVTYYAELSTGNAVKGVL